MDIYFQKFDEKDNTHILLAQLGEAAHNKAAKYVAQNPPKTPLAALQLGRLRTDIKKYLALEIKQIDELVATILN